MICIFSSPFEQEFKKHKVSHLVRACDPSYSIEPITRAGITVEVFFYSLDLLFLIFHFQDLPFDDGGVPADSIISRWLNICKDAFDVEGQAVGVHCVAGLGR